MAWSDPCGLDYWQFLRRFALWVIYIGYPQSQSKIYAQQPKSAPIGEPGSLRIAVGAYRCRPTIGLCLAAALLGLCIAPE